MLQLQTYRRTDLPRKGLFRTINLTRHLIKIFGERNTGTRAMIQMVRMLPHLTTANPALRKPPEILLLKTRIEDRLRGRWLKEYLEALNFDNRARVGGVSAWKHTRPKFDDSFAAAGASVIITVRNPYSWLISFAKRPYHAHGRTGVTLEQFIDFPWLTIPRDRLEAVLPSPMTLWNEKLRSYIAFKKTCTTPLHFMNFENFVQDPVKQMTNALQSFDLDPTGLAEISHSTKDNTRTAEDIRNFYAAEQWRSRLTRQSVALINDFTDWKVAAHFGYEMLNPRDFPMNLPSDIQQSIADDLNKAKKIRNRF